MSVEIWMARKAACSSSPLKRIQKTPSGRGFEGLAGHSRCRSFDCFGSREDMGEIDVDRSGWGSRARRLRALACGFLRKT